jgi:SAM-dependent methyltransferase
MTEQDQRKRFHKTTPKPNLIRRTFERLTRVYLLKISTDGYISYLREKTDMKIKTTLDIGTKYGTFVKSLEDMGIDATGIEPNQFYVHNAVTKNVQWDFFDEGYISNKKYDLISFGLSICYLPDTFEALKKVKSMLQPNGLCFISTYNPASGFRPQAAENPKSKADYEDMCRKLGFEMLDYSTYISNISLDGVARKNKIVMFLKYRFGNKRDFESQKDGFIAFMLLKNQ